MGLDFLRDQKEQFVQKRDKSKLAELSTGDLLTRGTPQEVQFVFNCQLTDPTAQIVVPLPLLGKVLLTPSPMVEVSQSGRVIGHLLEADAIKLVDLMKRNHRHSVITFYSHSYVLSHGLSL